MSQNEKILIIRFSSFGDVVQALSLPSVLARRFPQAQIDWVTRRDMAPLLERHPALRRVHSFERKTGLGGLLRLGWSLRAEGYTRIYDAHNNLRSRILCLMLRPFGWGPHLLRRSLRRWRRFLLFRFRINRFEQPFSGQRDLIEPLVAWGATKELPPPPQIFPSPETRRQARDLLGSEFGNAVALAPSAAHFLKRWPAPYWQDLILSLPEQKFVLLGGPEDAFIKDIVAVAPARCLNLAGHCSLLVSAAVVAESRLLVANDTGLLHVAEQLGKPAIALMGPAPFGFPSRPSTTILQLDLPCRPCSKHGQGPCVNRFRYHQCLVDISPAQVKARIELSLGADV